MDELLTPKDLGNTIRVGVTNNVAEPLQVIDPETAEFELLRASLGVIFGERSSATADQDIIRSGYRYRKQRRGGKGIKDIITSERNGPVVGVTPVRDGDEIMLITTQGMVNRTRVSEIRLIGRNTQGVRIMNLNEGDRIASLAKVAKEDVDQAAREESAETPPAEPPPPEPPTP